ncbi:MAG TPA: hypothetical protein VF221_18080 [Chloroflexota bacterium]
MIPVRAVPTRLAALACGAVMAAASMFPLSASRVLAETSSGQRSFWIAQNGTWQHVSCDRSATGEHITLYSCGSPELPPHDAGILTHVFDSQIFPRDIQLFGRPRGVRSVNVVMAPLGPMTSGYFDENDQDRSPAGDPAHSNHGNVLYLQSLALMPDSNKIADAEESLAHELQHLINYRIRVVDHNLRPDEPWLNEGLSFYAQMANGYWTGRDELKLQAAAAQPDWPVTALQENLDFLRRHARAAYGRAGLFLTYLAAHSGPGFIPDIVTNSRPDMTAINTLIRRTTPRRCAGDLFARWGVAQLLNGSGEYGYGRLIRGHLLQPRLSVSPIRDFPFDSNREVAGGLTMEPWTQRYIRLMRAAGTNLNVQVRASSGVRVAAVMSSSVPPDAVRWLHLGNGHTASLQVNNGSRGFVAVTIVASAAGPLNGDIQGGAMQLRIRATSVDAGDNN